MLSRGVVGGVQNFSMGSKPPELSGVKFSPSDTDQRSCVLDCNVRWNSELKAVLRIRPARGVPLLVGLSDLQLFGRLRITLAPLVPGVCPHRVCRGAATASPHGATCSGAGATCAVLIRPPAYHPASVRDGSEPSMHGG
jgi:hypothetical protein